MTRKTHENLGLHSDDGRMHLPKRDKTARAARRAMLIVLAILAIGTVRVILGRNASHAELATQSEESQKLYVKTVVATPSKSAGALTLPANLRGDNETTIYARVSGYVRSFNVEIGRRVEPGQLLAELDTPELDQQVEQAKAQLEQAKANVLLAKVALERWKTLFKQDSVARQDLDQHQNAYDTAIATQNAAEASLKQLQEMTAFKRVLAPFAGVITQRNVDVGNLINAGGTGVALFSMAKTDPLRVFLDLPQAYAQGIVVGAPIGVTLPELLGRVFGGKIDYISGAIDPTTRTQRVILMLPNADGALTPGAYVKASLPLAPRGPFSVPSNILLFRAQGPQAAVVDAEGHVRLRKLAIANDLGATLEIASGVGPQDRIIINPPDSLVEGEKVVVK